MAGQDEIKLKARDSQPSSIRRAARIAGGVLLAGVAAAAAWSAWDVYDTYQIGLQEKARRAARKEEERQKKVANAKRAAAAAVVFVVAGGLWFGATRLSSALVGKPKAVPAA